MFYILFILLLCAVVINLDASKITPMPSLLEPEAELRGFLPLHNYIKSLPQSSLIFDPAMSTTTRLSNISNGHSKSDSEVLSVLSFRIRKLKEFASFACGLV